MHEVIKWNLLPCRHILKTSSHREAELHTLSHSFQPPGTRRTHSGHCSFPHFLFLVSFMGRALGRSTLALGAWGEGSWALDPDSGRGSFPNFHDPMDSMDRLTVPLLPQPWSTLTEMRGQDPRAEFSLPPPWQGGWVTSRPSLDYSLMGTLSSESLAVVPY